jgi:DNA-binding response OmpR family regulator
MLPETYNVLVVDDETEALRMVGLMLRNSPFNIIPAHNGQDALAKAQSNDIDLVLLDIMMPDISGVTVCGHLRATPQLRDVPIVMLTALDDYATRRKAMQAGATDLMTKPVAKEELLSKLSGVMAEHQSGSRRDWAL